MDLQNYPKPAKLEQYQFLKPIVMNNETIDLKLLNYFVATADNLSFTAASERLGIPKSALSKGIAKLESELDSKLFERSSRVVRLSETGLMLYQRATVLLEESNNLINDIKTMQHSVSGRLKIAAPPILGRYIGKHILPKFLQQWPDVTVSLKSSYEYENLFTEGLDLAFRMGKNRDENLIERPLGFSNRVLVASPHYLKQFKKIQHPQDLSQLKSAQFYEQSPTVWTLQCGDATQQVSLPTAFLCGDLLALVNFVEGGMGIAQLPWLLVKDEIKAGKLIHVLPEWLSDELTISLVYREGYNKPNKLAKFLQWVEENKNLFDLRF
ncbi:HTH-type transcriptional regulator DmlR [Thalassocella blandensis]|nr:HTH-type transcriptional regulator DmlR [Thalassocella blandensis]